MPFYEYEHSCGYQALLQRKVGQHILGGCPGCGIVGELRPVINRHTAPNIMLSSVSNHIYNNGHGRYDEGLGRYIESREQHNRLMKEMDVAPMEARSVEEHIEAGERYAEKMPDVPMEKIKDRYEYYRNEVNQGLVFEDRPLPEQWQEDKVTEVTADGG